MKITKRLWIERKNKWEGIRFMPYESTEKGELLVYHWMLHLGFLRIIKFRLGSEQ